MKYAHIEKDTNKILGWYDSDIHSNIPEPNIQVLDAQWQIAINNGHNKVNIDGSTELYDFRTQEEIDLAENEQNIAEAKQYLNDTDYKVLSDYDGDTTGILEARAEARALIRSLEGSN